MTTINDLKNLSFLIYGLGLSGKSVVNFFNKNKFNDYQVWDDINRDLYNNKRPLNLNKTLKKVDYIVLSPGVSLNKSKNRNKLKKYENKIITDIDLFYLFKKNFKSIVVTGTNGKSTTCKIINHLLKKNKFKTLIGGNIGTPILNLKSKKNIFLIIEISSFQLAYSKFLKPDYALLLNITNDHIDWHGSMKNYVNSKFKIFKNQKKNQHSLINKQLSFQFKRRKLPGKLIVPKLKNYLKIKSKIKNFYLRSNINDENMSYVFELSKIFKISEKSFLKSLTSFSGLPHRYEIFLKRKNCTFINDSKATTFQSTKYALENSKNIYWILGGLPKKNDKIILKNLRENIVKSYIIGKNINFFKSQIQKKLPYFIAGDLKSSLTQVFKDIKIFEKKNNTILLSPASASYDQYLNFEKRGEEFKKLCRFYARKYI
tara:strand:+ start:1845 stop:3131 length:1287 start_codon:yes stop_codon:yes gene_type:complete